MPSKRNSSSSSSSNLEKARLMAPVIGHRITRLSIDLYVVEHLTNQGYSVAAAGLVYLVFNLVGLVSGCLNLWSPELSFGSIGPALIFFLALPTSAVIGLIGMFFSTKMPVVLVFAVLSGIGQKPWFSAYQTVINKTHKRETMSTIAQLRQAFECIGFLLPSIVLSVFNSLGDNSEVIIRRSIATLSAIAALSHALGADIIIRKASVEIERTSTYFACEESIIATAKRFLNSWAFVLNNLVASVLCFAVLVLGTASIVTKEIFSLRSTDLWIMGIGFPIGGILSVLWNLSQKKLSSDTYKSSKNGVWLFVAILTTCITGCFTEDSDQGYVVSIVLLFCYGLSIGFFYGGMYAASNALWLKEIHHYDSIFMSRSHIFLECIFSSVVSSIGFQLHTIIIDATLNRDDVSRPVLSLAMFGPIMALLLFCISLLSWIPHEPDHKFHWPLRFPKTSKYVVRVAQWMTIPPDPILFGKFSDIRSEPIMDRIDVDKINWAGPLPDESAELTVEDFRQHLNNFKATNESTNDEWYFSNEASLDTILFSNNKSLLKRQELINMAQKSIWIFTWSLDESTSFALADQLIAKKRKGVDVRVVIDAVNFWYINQVLDDFHSSMSDSVRVVKKLLDAGIEVRMFDRWKKFEETRLEPTVAGSHRKVMLVDDRWLLTGGRNVEDKYLIDSSDGNNEFRFHDLDVLLSGNFSRTTAVLLESLWKQARQTTSVFQKESAETKLVVDSTHDARPAFERGYSVWFDRDQDMFAGSLPPEFTDSIGRSRRTLSIDSMSLSLDLSDIDEVDEDFSSSSVQSTVELIMEDTEQGRHRGPIADKATRSEKARSSLFDKNFKGSEQVPLFPSEEVDSDIVSLFELDHQAGDPQAKDIIYSSLLFLIEKATKTIDLWFGYCTLFPEFEASIKRALSRGVRIRLVTNSRETNDLYFLTKVFSNAMEKLMEVGVEVYTPRLEDGESYCFHHKAMVVDGKTALIGSWNLMAPSIFFDDEYSVVIFGHEKTFVPFQLHFDEAVKGGKLQRITQNDLCTSSDAGGVPAWQRAFISKCAIRFSEIGY